MASGTINLNPSNASGSYIEGKIVWNSTADKNANTSDVTAKLYVRKDSTDTNLSIETTGTWTYKMKVGGNSVSGSVYDSVLTDWVLIATKKVSDIAHNSDGTKSITISGSVSAPGGTSFAGKTTSGGGTAEFDSIPRASTITSVADVTLGEKCSVKWTPASKSFQYKLRFEIGSGDGKWSHTTGFIHPNKTTAYTYTGYTIPFDALSAITGTNAEMTVSLYTYSSASTDDRIGNAATKTCTVSVTWSDETRPVVSVTLKPVSSLSAPFDALYIQGKSKVKATITATCKDGATVETCRLTVDGMGDYTEADDYTSDVLTASGQIAVYAWVTDSRNISGSDAERITVIPYSKPRIRAATGENGVVAARCDADGNLSDSGTYLRIKAKRQYSKVETADGQQNFCYIRYRYKAENGSYSSWKTILAKDALDSNEVDTGALLNGALLTTNAYVVQVGVRDDVGHYATTTIQIPTDKVYIHKAGSLNSMGLGKYVEEENLLDVAWNIRARGELRLGTEGLPVADFVIESGLFEDAVEGNYDGSWRYQKWDSGIFEMGGVFTVTLTSNNAFANNVAYYSNQIQLPLPFPIKSIQFTGTPAVNYFWMVNATVISSDEGIIGFRLVRFTEISTGSSLTVRLLARGRWK